MNELQDENQPKPERLTKRGFGARPILKSQILASQDNSKSAAEAARNLRISYNTYKKYAKMYGIMDRLKNQGCVGIVKKKAIRNKKYHIDELIKGHHTHYPLVRYKNKLFDSGYVPRVCSSCGFGEARISDGKYPLLIDFLDGNLNNRVLENIRPLCYNCFFLLVGDRKAKHYEAKPLDNDFENPNN